MLQKPAILYLLCGKIAAGKSTFANQLAERKATILLSEDHWMSNLFRGETNTIEDYVKNSARIRKILIPHCVSLLQEGVSIVLDFPTNTLEQRLWLREIFETADVGHELHFFDVPNDVCKRRLQARNEQGTHAFQVSEAEFDLFTSYFAPPTSEEGFNIQIHYL